MNKVISNRSEFIFLYDIKDANPNGDPLDSNKPRIDEETGKNLVTDVRIKRTIRDYLYTYEEYNGKEGKDIFVRETKADEVGIKSGKGRAKDFDADPKKLLENCIDIRLFGAVVPLDKDSITYTGPIQLQMARSMHAVEMKYIKGTGAFASKEGNKNSTFREEYVLPYSLIACHGIINEYAAIETQLTEEDVKLFQKALWEGTKNLITRSKFGQLPRLFINVVYKDKGFFIGDLQQMIALKTDKRDEELRDIADFQIDVTLLKEALMSETDRIAYVEYKIDSRLSLVLENEQSIDIEALLPNKMKKIQY